MRRPVVKLTDVLRGEHGVFYALLNEIEEMTSYAGEVVPPENLIGHRNPGVLDRG
jgi:hypothetical protein